MTPHQPVALGQKGDTLQILPLTTHGRRTGTVLKKNLRGGGHDISDDWCLKRAFSRSGSRLIHNLPTSLVQQVLVSGIGLWRPVRCVSLFGLSCSTCGLKKEPQTLATGKFMYTWVKGLLSSSPREAQWAWCHGDGEAASSHTPDSVWLEKAMNELKPQDSFTVSTASYVPL